MTVHSSVVVIERPVLVVMKEQETVYVMMDIKGLTVAATKQFLAVKDLIPNVNMKGALVRTACTIRQPTVQV